jgi:SulP family sulfate permease
MTVSPASGRPPANLPSLRIRAGDAAAWTKKNGPLIGSNALAGLVASLLTIAYCLSFSALLFQGQLGSGLGPGLWALLVGSAIAGLYVSLTTSLPPAEAGPDNPAVAVLSVLAATVSGQVFAAGGDAALAVDCVLLSFTLATLVTGAVLYLLGRLKLGQYVRFIPYPVIGGFLAASGWFLIAGGIEVMTGTDLTLANLADAIPADRLPMLLLGVTFAAAIYILKTRTGNIYILPIAFIGGSLVLDAALWTMGLMHGDSRWFVSGASEVKPWVPLAAAFERDIDWTVFLKVTTEIGAVAGVTVIALLLDVTGLEVARTKSANLDWEFRTNGFANIIAAPLGGVMGNLSLNGSRLLDETGGFARVSGVFASLVVALIVVTGIDLPGYVPKPILAGLLMYLGLVVLADVLLRSPAHRAWADFGLALAIMVAIVVLGYLAGIVLGVVAACLMFAFSYSRIAVIRRHLTRAVFASNMDRSSSAARHLQEEGDRIHVFWLSGFIFFGSSNGVFESIRDAIQGAGDRKRRFAVLDFSDVSGFDTSALLSLVKLRNYADDHGVTLAFAGLSQRMSSALEHLALFGASAIHRQFATRNEALEWCENEVLNESRTGDRVDAAEGLEGWLETEIGNRKMARRLVQYFERRDVAAGSVLYMQGSPADTIDLVITGRIAVSVASEPGLELVVRRMSTRTVVGEMGFFRGTVRTATVSADEPASIYTMTRASYEKLKTEEPEIGTVFLEFIARTLSDRLDFATQGIAALS